jgi:hypothetical protein
MTQTGRSKETRTKSILTKIPEEEVKEEEEAYLGGGIKDWLPGSGSEF